MSAREAATPEEALAVGLIRSFGLDLDWLTICEAAHDAGLDPDNVEEMIDLAEVTIMFSHPVKRS